MNEKMYNALNDPKVEFVLVPSAKLKEEIMRNANPAIVRLPQSHKAALLELQPGYGLLVDRSMIIKYLEGKCNRDEQYVIGLCEVRVIGVPSVKLPAKP